MFVASDLKLLVACGAIYLSYFVYGICQEKIMTTKFDGTERFALPLFLLFVQCFFNSGLAWAALRLQRAPPDATPPSEYALMSAAYIGYIDYPTQALGKSVKPIAVIIVISILLRRRYPAYKYALVVAIGGGVALFSLYAVRGAVADSLDPSALAYGRALIGLSLVADGLTAALQERVTVGGKLTNSFNLMLACNLWAGLYLTAGVLLTGELAAGVRFVHAHPACGRWLVLFSVSSAAGQAAIYWLIRAYSSLVCSIVTTTRKFFTLVISVLMFGHELAWQQWLSVFIVFGGLLVDIYMGARARQAANKMFRD